MVAIDHTGATGRAAETADRRAGSATSGDRLVAAIGRPWRQATGRDRPRGAGRGRRRRPPRWGSATGWRSAARRSTRSRIVAAAIGPTGRGRHGKGPGDSAREARVDSRPKGKGDFRPKGPGGSGGRPDSRNRGGRGRGPGGGKPPGNRGPPAAAVTVGAAAAAAADAAAHDDLPRRAVQAEAAVGPAERAAIVEHLRRAVAQCPTVRAVPRRQARAARPARLRAADGRGLSVRAGLEFDDVEGLEAYLQSPAHAGIGGLFTSAASASLAYDYELTCEHLAGRALRIIRARSALALRARASSAGTRLVTKNSSMISRSCAIDSAALIATRRWEPLSRPLVYQEFSARSLLITHRSRPRAGAGGFAAPDPGRRAGSPAASSDALLEQQIDVVEQELPALGGRNLARRVAGGERRACSKIHGLRSAPRPTSTPRHRAVAQPIDELLRLDAIAAAEHRNAHARRDTCRSDPSPRSRSRTAPRCGRAR